MDFLNFCDLTHIRDEDEGVVGKQITNLAKLKRLGFPVAKALVVLPPNLTKYTQTKDDFLSLAIPDQLKKYEKERLDVKNAWKNLTSQWHLEFSYHQNRNLTPKLSSQVLFLGIKFRDFGRASVDPYTNTVDIQIDGGELSESIRSEIEKLVVKADRKLVFNHVYHWVNDRGVKLIKVLPHTPVEPITAKVREAFAPGKPTPVKRFNKTYTKCFFDLAKDMVTDAAADGVIVDSVSLTGGIDEKIWRLIEVCSSHPSEPVIFIIDSKKVKEDAHVFLFLRNKKQFLNLNLCLPNVTSSEEMAAVKRELASLHISRKGSLKLWLSVGVLENLINVDDYLEVGIDGLIINLDKLSSCLGETDEKDLKKTASSMCKLLGSHIDKMNKAKVLQLYVGNILYSDELIRFLVEKKVYGVIVNTTAQHGVREYLMAVEQFYFNH